MKICLYGAGIYANRYLSLLSKQYEIEYVLDLSKDKQGKCVENVKIVKPDETNVNLYPVVLAMRNVASGYETLMSFHCTQDIYVLISAGKKCYMFLFNSELNIGKMLLSTRKIGDDISVVENGVTNVLGKRRCFDMTWRSSELVDAGPAACVHKLWSLNEQCGLIDNLYTLWPDKVFVPKATVEVDSFSFDDNLEDGIEEYDDVFESLKRYPIMYAAKYIEAELIRNYWRQMNKVFNFVSSDLFIIQDNISAYALSRVFPQLNNVIVVYHSQGSLKYEKIKSDPLAGEMYDAIQAELLRCAKKWVFPSKGAADALFATGSSLMKSFKEKCDISIVHSGYQPKEIEPTPSLGNGLKTLAEVDVTFVTATKLYYSKGVEFIPAILSKFKKQTGLKIRWFLIGSGEMEQAVQKNIDEYLSPDDYIWYKERFPSQDDLFHIFSLADFYILMHRVSIFDLSILQAMSYGCIPFLSNVGGNKEFCSYNNGLLVDHDCDSLDLSPIMRKSEVSMSAIKDFKEWNKKVVMQHFSYKNFIIGFKNIIEHT